MERRKRILHAILDGIPDKGVHVEKLLASVKLSFGMRHETAVEYIRTLYLGGRLIRSDEGIVTRVSDSSE